MDKRNSPSSFHHVSVIIPVRNCRDLLDTQLEALSAQTFSGSFEVIISDNGSTDGLAEHIATHPLRSELRIIYVDSSARPGPAHARNEGAKHASGNFLAFCDADDRVHPEWIAQLVGLAEEFDVVGGPFETHSLNSPRIQSWVPCPPPEEQGKAFMPYTGGGNLGCRASVFRALGGMNENLLGSEDVEFVWRAQLDGYSFGFLKEALVGVRLRQTCRELWKQGRALGYGSAQLLSLYREVGAPGVSMATFLRHFAIVVIRNPLLPVWLTRMPRARWGLLLAVDMGMLLGGIKFKVLTLW